MKKGRSLTPCTCVLGPFTFELNDSAGCVGGPVVEVVQDIFLLAFDSVTYGDDFPDACLPHVLVPFVQCFFSFSLVLWLAADIA